MRYLQLLLICCAWLGTWSAAQAQGKLTGVVLD